MKDDLPQRPRVLAAGVILLLAAWSILGCSESTDAGSDGRDDRVVAFEGAHVVPMDAERVLEHRTVVVRNGSIAEIGPADAVDVPDGALRIDARGKYLLPGLTDFHIHLRSTDELVSYLAYGVTTVVHLSGAMNGVPDLLRVRERLARVQLPGPTLFTTGPILDGDPPIFPAVSVVVTTPDEAKRVVAEQKRSGYDFIKVYNQLRPDVLETVAAAADEHGMAVVGHIPRREGRDQALQQALGAGVDVIAHGEEYFFTYFYRDVEHLLDQGRIPYPDETRIPAAVRLTKEAGAAVIPNLSFVAATRRQLDSLDAVLSDPEARYLDPDVLEMWREQNPTRRPDRGRFDRRERAKYSFLGTLAKALSDAGVPLLLGTDASAPGVFPGRSAHEELHELVEAGLTPYDALAAGTRNAGALVAKHLPSVEPFGVVAVGRKADLLLVEGNPLVDVGHAGDISGVMVQGRWFSRAELEDLRDAVVRSHGR